VGGGGDIKKINPEEPSSLTATRQLKLSHLPIVDAKSCKNDSISTAVTDHSGVKRTSMDIATQFHY
jgi:hypothetical protein